MVSDLSRQFHRTELISNRLHWYWIFLTIDQFVFVCFFFTPTHFVAINPRKISNDLGSSSAKLHIAYLSFSRVIHVKQNNELNKYSNYIKTNSIRIAKGTIMTFCFVLSYSMFHFERKSCVRLTKIIIQKARTIMKIKRIYI